MRERRAGVTEATPRRTAERRRASPSRAAHTQRHPHGRGRDARARARARGSDREPAVLGGSAVARGITARRETRTPMRRARARRPDRWTARVPTGGAGGSAADRRSGTRAPRKYEVARSLLVVQRPDPSVLPRRHLRTPRARGRARRTRPPACSRARTRRSPAAWPPSRPAPAPPPPPPTPSRRRTAAWSSSVVARAVGGCSVV